MQVTVTITDPNPDEIVAMERWVVEANAARAQARRLKLDLTPEFTSAEEVCVLRIREELAQRAKTYHDERIAAQRPLGEVLAQLPPEAQARLKAQLVEEARAAGVDTTTLEGGEAP